MPGIGFPVRKICNKKRCRHGHGTSGPSVENLRYGMTDRIERSPFVLPIWTWGHEFVLLRSSTFLFALTVIKVLALLVALS